MTLDGPRVKFLSAPVVLFVLLALASTHAHGEVMDKEASASDMWWVAVGVGVLAILAWSWRKVAGAVLSAYHLLFFSVIASELADPSVGPAILSEAGPNYTRHFWAAALVGTALQFTAVLLAFYRDRQKERVELEGGPEA